MVALREALELATNDFMCRVMTNGDAPDNLVQRAVRTLPGGRDLTDTLSNARDAFRDLVCDPARPQTPQPGDNFPTTAPPSGFCPVSYCVYVQIIATVTSSGAPFDNGPQDGTKGLCTYQGPISEPFIAPGAGGFPNVFVTDDNGTTVAVGNVNGLSDITLIAQHRRVDGLPDECPENPPFVPDLPSTTVPVPYDDADNNPVTIDVDIEVQPPQLNANGTLIIPVGIFAPTFQLNAKVNLNLGGVSLNFGGGNETATDCCAPVEDDPEAPNDEPADPPPPPDSIRFRTVKVATIVEPASGKVTTVGNGVGPNLKFPYSGLISFACELGGYRSWSVDVPIKKTTQFVTVPDGLLGYTWNVFAQPGYAFSVTPIPIRE